MPMPRFSASSVMDVCGRMSEYLPRDTPFHAADGSAPPRLCGLAIETTVPCAGPVGVFAFVTVTLPL